MHSTDQQCECGPWCDVVLQQGPHCRRVAQHVLTVVPMCVRVRAHVVRVCVRVCVSVSVCVCGCVCVRFEKEARGGRDGTGNLLRTDRGTGFWIDSLLVVTVTSRLRPESTPIAFPMRTVNDSITASKTGLRVAYTHNTTG